MRWSSSINAMMMWRLWIPLVSLFIVNVHCFQRNKPGVRHFASARYLDDSGLLQLDPDSDYAHFLLSERLGLSVGQRDQLRCYCEYLAEWNDKINLVSRKDCSVSTVLGRHVLPCLAPLLLYNKFRFQDGDQVVDVGTGGGFPGIPLAVSFPNCEFLLVDSVGKKLVAVDDMVSRLQLSNVQTMHSRAEDIHERQFDWCVGRSVASLPQYCSWIQHLLKPTTGKLLYIVGGDVPEASQAEQDSAIHDLFVTAGDGPSNSGRISEKRILLFNASAVKKIAKSHQL
jgi:16S rRNA (guanine527-N7)-methyltransferase